MERWYWFASHKVRTTMTIGRKYTQRIKDRGLSRLLDHRTRSVLNAVSTMQKAGPTKVDPTFNVQPAD